MAKTFFIPNKDSILGQQEVLTAKSILALVEGLESHSYDAVPLIPSSATRIRPLRPIDLQKAK